MLLHPALMRLELLQPGFKGLEPLTPFSEPPSIPFEFQIAVPGFDGVHQLGAIFHHESFVEEHHRVVGSQLVGTAKIVKRRGAIVLASVAVPRSK